MPLGAGRPPIGVGSHKLHAYSLAAGVNLPQSMSSRIVPASPCASETEPLPPKELCEWPSTYENRSRSSFRT
jgi:hypothetical protein